MISEKKRIQVDAMVDVLLRCWEESINVVAFSIDYDAGTITITLGE